MPKITLNDESSKRERNEDGTFKEGGATDLSPPVYSSILLHVDGAFLCRQDDTYETMSNLRNKLIEEFNLLNETMPIVQWSICIEKRAAYNEYISDPHFHIHMALTFQYKYPRYGMHGITEKFPYHYPKITYHHMTFPHKSFPEYCYQYVHKQRDVISKIKIDDNEEVLTKVLPEKLWQDPRKKEKHIIQCSDLTTKSARTTFILEVIERYNRKYGTTYNYSTNTLSLDSKHVKKEDFLTNLRDSPYMNKYIIVCDKEINLLIK